MSAEAYLDKAITLLRDIRETQIAPIKEAGRLCSTALKSGGLIHVFGTVTPTCSPRRSCQGRRAPPS